LVLVLFDFVVLGLISLLPTYQASSLAAKTVSEMTYLFYVT